MAGDLFGSGVLSSSEREPKIGWPSRVTQPLSYVWPYRATGNGVVTAACDVMPSLVSPDGNSSETWRHVVPKASVRVARAMSLVAVPVATSSAMPMVAAQWLSGVRLTW